MNFENKIDFRQGSPVRKIICEEFKNSKWELFRNWFFKNFDNQDRQLFQEIFYKELIEENKIIPFVPWFLNKYTNSMVSVIQREYNVNGKILKTIFPPHQPFKIEKDNEIRFYQAFQKLLENDTLPITISHINNLFKQQNYTNICLIVIGEQLNSINDRINELISQIKNIKNPLNNKKEESSSITPGIQPPPEIKNFKLKPENEMSKLLDEKLKVLSDSFKNLRINTLTEEFVSTIDENNYQQKINDEISKLHKFADRPTQRMYYYPRPTPQDVLIEEQEYVVNNSYHGKHIYEWNIDGNTERQIYNVIHRMMMYSTICKNNGNTDKDITKMIIAGFTGQLKGWWDNYLSQNDKNNILNAVKEEDNRQQENTVYTLVVNIIEHFTGRWSDNSENIRTLLQNLRCRTLTSFRWYKDTFLSRVMELPESNSTHWKSKFIDGLPPLFAERVRKNLRKGEISINYDDYTYGKLIGTCVQEGLALCNEIKLNQQIKKHSLNEKKQLGQFCSQFGMEEVRDNNNPKKRKSLSPQKIKKFQKRKQKREDRKFKRKKEFKSFKPYIICKKCGRPGHKAKTCWVKKKINNIEDEQLRDTYSKLLINSESESETENLSYEDINILENESLTSSDEECISCKKGESCCENNSDTEELYQIISQFQNMEINVITNDMLDLLRLIEEPELREKIASKIIRENEESTSKEKQDFQPYTLMEVKKQLKQKYKSEKPVDIEELKIEVNNLKKEINHLKENNEGLEKRIEILEEGKKSLFKEILEGDLEEHNYLSILEIVTSQKWHIEIKLLIDNNWSIKLIALLDSGADLNCIQEGLIPTKYFHKTTHKVSSANGKPLHINYKLPQAYVCKEKMCIPTSFLLVKDLTSQVILGTPFLKKLFPIKKIDEKSIIGTFQGKEITFSFISEPKTRFINEIKKSLLQAKENQINFLKQEINILKIEERLKNPKLQDKIKLVQNQFSLQICNDHPNAFWDRKKHIVSLPYEDDFNESQIPTKARPCQMNSEYLELCKKEIKSLIDKGLIKPSKSSWSCTAFYVNKHSEQERGAPRLVINYKPLNKVLKWIRYPIPNKKDLLDRLHNAIIFSKFDLKSGYWQIQIDEKDRYKTAFTVPIGHYEWNVMPFGLKNAPSEFQNIMNDIFIPYSDFIIVYIDDILVFSKNIEIHFKHLEIFKSVIIKNGLVISRPKMMLFQTNVRFLGHNIEKGNIVPINRSIEFASKFPDEITEKTQLQRFLGSLNYISPYYKNLAEDTAVLYDRLKKSPLPWSDEHTKAIQKIKQNVKNLPCLSLAKPDWEKIIETDASNIGYGGILKQISPIDKQEYLVRFHSGKWNNSQKNYATIAKEILAIVKCVLKFQDDLYNQKFLIKTDCQAAKYMFNKDFKHDVSKQMFARWQSHLAPFDFEIIYKKGTDNSLPDFLTREYLNE